MKKILNLIIPLALCVTLAACNGSPAVNADNSGGNSSSSTSEMVSEAPTNKPADTTTDTPAGADKTVSDLDDMYHAYKEALENLIQNHVLPDGTDAAEQSDDMSQNKFALYDVDNDGKEELLLMYTNTYMAGETGYVFGYDETTKKLQTELSEFPMLTFYDNGVIKAGWSHNQGLAGDNFWPYSLYQYAPDSDSYKLVGMVDAWDKNFSETNDQKNPFPSDIDKSGTGVVYYIMKDGQYDTSHPVDASEYKQWLDTYIGGASEIQIPYMDLTAENIAQIGNRA